MGLGRGVSTIKYLFTITHGPSHITVKRKLEIHLLEKKNSTGALLSWEEEEKEEEDEDLSPLVIWLQAFYLSPCCVCQSAMMGPYPLLVSAPLSLVLSLSLGLKALPPACCTSPFVPHSYPFVFSPYVTWWLGLMLGFTFYPSTKACNS